MTSQGLTQSPIVPQSGIMHRLLLLIIAASFAAGKDFFQVFESTLATSDLKSFGGATLVTEESSNVDPNINVDEFTLCYRFTLKVLGGEGSSTRRLLHIGDWEEEDRDK